MKRSVRFLAIPTAAVVAASLAVTAWAYWAGTGSGSASASVATLAAPDSVTVPSTSDGTVPVSWTASSTSPPNIAPTGYYVQRTKQPSGPTTAACATSPSDLTAALSCNDSSILDGTYKYTVTAVFRSWTAASAASGSVVVTNDSVPPTTTAALSPLPNGAGWNNSNVTVTLSALDNPGGSGVASIVYSATGAQTIANTPYTGPFTITSEGTTTVSFHATDTAGNVEGSKTQVVKLDKTPPAVSTPSIG